MLTAAIAISFSADALLSARRWLDYIAANSITLSSLPRVRDCRWHAGLQKHLSLKRQRLDWSEKSGARFLTTRHLSGGQKKPRHSCRGLVGKKAEEMPSGMKAVPGRVLANVCGSLEMNKFHSYVVFFNGPHCARPEQIYF
jgi:hypothetical protein